MDIKKIVEDLRVLADDLEKGVTEETPKEKEPTTTKEPTTPKEPIHTYDEIREKLSKKSQDGYTEAVRDAIIKCGGTKLSNVPIEKYDELYEEALKIGGEK